MVTTTGIMIVFMSIIFILAIVILIFYRFYFLRRPVRNIPTGNTLVSPANGKIVRILEIGSKNETNKQLNLKKGVLGKVKLLTEDTLKKGSPGYVIVIRMTPFNVHYQRSPVSGTIVETKHSKGKFLNAVKDAESMQTLVNEKNEILIENPKIGKVKVVQVAGFLARRILCSVSPKQKIHKGMEIGLICLGSQVLLVIPKLKLNIREGQDVIDGETIIARF